jgi:hypothetical protein
MEKPLIHVNVKFSDHAAAELLLGKHTKSETVFQVDKPLGQLLSRHSKGKTGARLALRCSRGPGMRAGLWYRDIEEATETIVLALNDDSEYSGGRMVFFSPTKGVEVITKRNAGDMIKHSNKTVHAVTLLTYGSRYELSISDESNDLEHNYVREASIVVEATLEITQEILSQM